MKAITYQVTLALVSLTVGACAVSVDPPLDFAKRVVQVTNPTTGQQVSRIDYCSSEPPVVLRIQMRNLRDFRAKWVQLGADFGVSTLAVLPDKYRNSNGLPYGQTTTTRIAPGPVWSGYLDITINGGALPNPSGQQEIILKEVNVNDKNPENGFSAIADPPTVSTESFSHRKQPDPCNNHAIYH